jgi:outer membrane lipoprotein-sorting protein
LRVHLLAGASGETMRGNKSLQHGGIMAGMRQGLWVGVVLVGIVALTRAGMAETVPLPRAAPQPKEGIPPAAAAPQNPVEGLAAGLRSLFRLDKDEQPGGASPAAAIAPGGFNPAQRAQVDKVSAYLSSVQQLVGNFVQVGPDGSRSKGQFYMQKPGKVRFEYDPPSPIEIVADGQSVVVRDRRLATQDLYPLSQTPLRFLLSDRIDLLRETSVVAVRSDEAYVTVVIEERQALIGTSRLMMMMGAKDYQLKQWTVTDPQGYDTTVAVSNLDTSKRPDPVLFRIDYTRYVQ